MSISAPHAWQYERGRVSSPKTSYPKTTPSGSFSLNQLIGGIRIREHLKMVTIADFLIGVDIDPNNCHWSLFSLRFPQCVSLRDESNSRTWAGTTYRSSGPSNLTR